MPKNSTSRTSGGELIVNHYGAIRLTVTGTGNLRPTFYGLDKKISFTALPIPLPATTDIEFNRITNFTRQRASLVLTTTGFQEWFSITRLVVFVRPVAKSLPEAT